MTLVATLWIVLVISVALTAVQTFIAARFLRSGRPIGLSGSLPASAPGRALPSVSILKPLCGRDAHLAENLECFAALSGFRWELILSVADPRDEAVSAARELIARHPEAPIRLVVGGTPPGAVRNPKVERLVAAARVASGDVFFISDANACVRSDGLRETLALFADPKVGCVSNVFVGDEVESLGARLESLYLLTFVLPGTALAAAAGFPCVVGKSMAISRAAHDEIGGFAAVGDVLAEDQALGLAVREAGYDVVLSPIAARNVLGRRTLGQALSRQVRWGQIRFSLSPATYTGELLLNPLAVALAALVAAITAAPALAGTATALAALAAVLRVGQAALLGRATGTRPALGLVPLKDLLQLGAHFVPYATRIVVWEGKRSRLARGTLLVPETPGTA